jgi:hypothetical protein
MLSKGRLVYQIKHMARRDLHRAGSLSTGTKIPDHVGCVHTFEKDVLLAKEPRALRSRLPRCKVVSGLAGRIMCMGEISSKDGSIHSCMHSTEQKRAFKNTQKVFGVDISDPSSREQKDTTRQDRGFSGHRTQGAHAALEEGPSSLTPSLPSCMLIFEPMVTMNMLLLQSASLATILLILAASVSALRHQSPYGNRHVDILRHERESRRMFRGAHVSLTKMTAQGEATLSEENIWSKTLTPNDYESVQKNMIRSLAKTLDLEPEKKRLTVDVLTPGLNPRLEQKAILMQEYLFRLVMAACGPTSKKFNRVQLLFPSIGDAAGFNKYMSQMRRLPSNVILTGTHIGKYISNKCN